MYPWLWFWAPQVHFPWSGDVAQRIDPSTQFFQGIRPGAGNARIEEKAFAVASYGKQLGLITDILIELAEQTNARSPAAAASLDKLKRIRDQIEAIKNAEYDGVAVEIESRIAELRRKGGDRYVQLTERLVPLLSS